LISALRLGARSQTKTEYLPQIFGFLVSAVRVAVPALPIRVGLVSKRSAGHDRERHGGDGANSHRMHHR
jgi:hypothetical protein